MPSQIRLNKYIASSGMTSRRGADELIKEGKVKVNRKIVTSPGTLIDEKDKVEINGRKIFEQEKNTPFSTNLPAI
ncbi:MAG: S4 domain-containing protein [Ignavibacteriales bacterium]|nr:S4 domain-containing protein [Ignavibacteriales bacterium]